MLSRCLALLLLMLMPTAALAAADADLQIQALKPGASVLVEQAPAEGKLVISVEDAQKQAILGLGTGDFAVTQAGRTAKIVSVQPFEQDLDVQRHIVLVLDNSFSMQERNAVKPLLAAVDELLKIVRPIDQVSLVVFDDRKTANLGGRDLHVQTFQSGDAAALRAFVAKAYSGDGMTAKTVLFEAIQAGLALVAKLPKEAPKFMVVFSDGEDLNSAFKGDKVVHAGQDLAKFSAYTIDYMPGDGIDPFLHAFATEHQGQVWKAREETSLVPIFQEVATRLQRYYVVSYIFPPTGSLALAPAGLTIEEVKTFDASPMLAHVYFDENSAEIPDRYARYAETGQVAGFDASQLRGTLDKYYQVLNLLGRRLADNPDANITIVGCNANLAAEKKNTQLSMARAEAVQAYLSNVWGIAPERMALESRNLPEMPSTSRIAEGQADNRRAEIRSPHPAVLDLVRSTYISTAIDTKALTLQPSVDSAYGFNKWSATASAGGRQLGAIGGEGNPAGQLTLPLQTADLDALAKAGSVAVAMTLEDRKGQSLSLTPAPLPITFIETRQRIAERQDVRVQEKYALILFDFDSDAIGERNQAIVAEIVARIRELPTASVAIVGHTDNIGKDDYNQKLSERRAKAVYDQIMAMYGEDAAGRIQHSGVGAGEPLYENSSSEARAFNRTVTVTLEYLAKE